MKDSRLNEVLNALYPVLIAQADQYLDAAKEELELLDLDATDEEVMVLADLVRSAHSLEEATTALHATDESQVRQAAEREWRRMQVNEGRKTEAENRSALAEVKEAILNLAEQFEYQDYYVIARSGDDCSNLNTPVRKALSQGWTPIGGIHVAGPLPNGTMLFSQAVGLPKGKPAQDDYDFDLTRAEMFRKRTSS